MKKIGFIDYYLSEWHANNYPGWIREICKKEGKDIEIAYAWAEKEVSPVYGKTTDDWCAQFGATRCNSIEEVCEKSDYILILAPSDPEKHLGYAKVALKYGKNTYIDKTFAPDYKTAKEIYAIAEKYGTKIFSTSALRYAEELAPYTEAKSVLVTGGGVNFAEYLIHPVEMLVKMMGIGARRVKAEKSGAQCFCRIDYGEGREGSLLFATEMPNFAYAEKKEGGEAYLPIASDFFKGLMADILRFYETGEVSFPEEQTFEAMRVRDAILKAAGREGEWIPVEN